MPATATPTTFDAQRRYVRSRNVRADGFVEFEFAIGDPDLSVELILPQAAFMDFCAAQQVIWVDERQGMEIDQARKRWSQLDEADDNQETTP